MTIGFWALAIAMQLDVAPVPASGSLTVCAFDGSRTRLPGVEITVSQPGGAKHVGVTVSNGCVDLSLAAG